MLMVTSLLSTLGGALFGGVQNYLEHSKEHSKEISLAKIQAEKEIALSKQGVVISQNQLATQQSLTTQEEFKMESSIKESEVAEYKAFTDAVVQTSSIWNNYSKFAELANFIIVTTRPIVTYILLILVFIVSLKIIKNIEVSQNHLMIFDLILAEFSAVMSYWFVRRSFEKRYTPQLQKKN
jgi:hypothetical protein